MPRRLRGSQDQLGRSGSSRPFVAPRRGSRRSSGGGGLCRGEKRAKVRLGGRAKGAGEDPKRGWERDAERADAEPVGGKAREAALTLVGSRGSTTGANCSFSPRSPSVPSSSPFSYEFSSMDALPHHGWRNVGFRKKLRLGEGTPNSQDGASMFRGSMLLLNARC